MAPVSKKQKTDRTPSKSDAINELVDRVIKKTQKIKKKKENKKIAQAFKTDNKILFKQAIAHDKRALEKSTKKTSLEQRKEKKLQNKLKTAINSYNKEVDTTDLSRKLEAKSWKAWKLPGASPRAYSVWVDERDGVWLTEWTANAIVRQMLGRAGEAWGAESGNDRLVVIKY